ncbi:MAG: hypothetical protein ACHBN1_13170 [Heteroscytonema crispum UTEX LB 1556]
MSQEQVGRAVDLQGVLVLRFLESKQPEALPDKDFKNYKIASISRDNEGRGGRGQIKTVFKLNKCTQL